ncbi:MgtC/SapB family protein [Pseudothauera rhizosphaerae]|uniref:MgtC/SapB family protein n=1 Tax=Pseudothauera rhizosphaerae TaxID=2565932 RepID=A0A4S4AY10_9RHOO|nr:MgtC/SapB family protein [Pseudothauera rhizosphaerae]THF63492.1 MgtC/SapB family protein [Pseudothauera rhizosphaerae]
MPFSIPFDTDQGQAFLIAIGIGLLIGLERERVASARAGLRTFGLVGMLGALTGLLGQQLSSILPLAVGMAVIGAMIIAAYLRHPDPSDPGTTSVAALLVCYCLGAAVWYGHAQLAVMLAVGTTVLLYFKAQLRGIATRLQPRDWISILQFGVLSLVILPILPDREFGPYAALNPYQIWWMVVLISGVSLAGYAALQLAGARYGAAFVGIFGGLASSTATTMVYARYARETPAMATMAALVIVLANLVMVVRVGIVALVVAPGVISQLLTVVVPALLLGLFALLWNWRRLTERGEAVLPETTNPTELRTALGFGALYAVVLLIAAWLSDIAGNRGLYALALVSGLTDIDAIALSSLRLFALDKLALGPTVIAIGLGMLANLGFKTGLAMVIGGRELGLKVLGGMGAVGIGVLGGIAWSALGAQGL